MFGAARGFACVRRCWLGVGRLSFWSLALIPLGQVVLVFAVRGLCGHVIFLALGLTRRSTGPLYCGRLSFFMHVRERHMEWMIQNKEWIFSGIGGLLISLVVGLFAKRNKSSKQTQISGSNSTNYQSGRDINIGVKND